MRPTIKQALERPDVRVYLIALHLVRTGKQQFSCLAIQAAVKQRFPKAGEESTFALWALYKNQYRRSCTSEYQLPNWWNGQGSPSNRAHRMSALGRMAQMCDDAGKRAG